jgi:uncharacterized protein
MARITTQGDAACFEVHVVPRASRSAIVGEHDGRVKIALAAPPVDGAANEALLALLSELLERPRRDLRIVRGESSRRKLVAIRAMAAPELEARLARFTASARSG